MANRIKKKVAIVRHFPEATKKKVILGDPVREDTTVEPGLYNRGIMGSIGYVNYVIYKEEKIPKRDIILNFPERPSVADFEKAKTLVIEFVGIEKEERGKGYFSDTMKTLERLAKMAKCNAIRLDHVRSPIVREWAIKNGYKKSPLKSDSISDDFIKYI